VSRRTAYNLALKAAVGAVLEGQRELSLAAIETAIGTSIAVPGRPTLARAVSAHGWTKVQRPGSGAIFRAPAPPPCTCAECRELDCAHPGEGQQLALIDGQGRA
jgi:hypothetical protein